MLNATGAYALPAGGQVTAGQATISSPTATQLNITQGSNQAIVNWNSFSIGSGEAVNITQPTSQSTLLNRVVGNNPSQIFGSLNANGQVFLINPGGVLFAPGSSVNVGGLVASSLNIKDSDFLSGKYAFYKDGTADAVINRGNISGGFVALLGSSVENAGTIVTTKGTTALAAGDAITLGFDPNGLMAIKVDKAAYQAQVTNSGIIEADGGTVVMTASAADALLATVVNNSGTVRARGMVERNGEIIIEGGSVNNSGTLDASGLSGNGGKIAINAAQSIGHTGTINVNAAQKSSGSGGSLKLITDLANMDGITTINGSISARAGDLGGDGGFVETSGGKVKIGKATHVDTRAPLGKNGQWLLDPVDFNIAMVGGDIDGPTLSTLLGSTSIIVKTDGTTASCTDGVTACGTVQGINGPGDILVNDNIFWNAPTSLTLDAWNSIKINSQTEIQDAGAGLNLYYGNVANSLNANSRLEINAPVNMLPGATLSTRYNGLGSNYTIFDNLDDLRNAIIANINGNYALGNNLDLTDSASGNQVNMLSGFGTSFTGQFEGLGHTISNFTITYPGSADIGLFGRLDGLGTIRNLTLDNAVVDGASNVGVLVGRAGGDYSAGLTSIYNVHVTNSTVTAHDAGDGVVNNAGGLVGNTWGGNIDNSSASNVTVSGSGDNVGGLAGQLIEGNITNSSATGTATTTGSNVGGLAGLASTLNTVDRNYAQVDIDGKYNVGGLFGNYFGFNVSNSYYPIESVTIKGDGMASGTHLVTAYGLYAAQWTDWIADKSLGTPDTYFGAVDSNGYYIVDNAAKLKALLGFTASYDGETVNNKFKLGSNFDIAAVRNGFDGYDWHLPVFVASELNGDGHALINLNVNQSFNDNIGLIGKLGPTSDLKNLTLSDATIAGRNTVGGAVGFAYGNGDGLSNPISNVSVIGTSTIQGGTGMDDNAVGGLVGYSQRSVEHSEVGSTVTVSGNRFVGGLIGDLRAEDTSLIIDTNRASATVSGAEYVGGLIGNVEATGFNALTSINIVGNNVGGAITGSGDFVGGLTGNAVAYGAGSAATLTIQNNQSDGSTSVIGNNNVGGLVGFTQAYGASGDALVQFRDNTTNGSTQGVRNVGGLVGNALAGGDGSYYGSYNPSTISFQRNNVSGLTSGDSAVGGLVGFARAAQSVGSTTEISFDSDTANGNVSGRTQVGGLIGRLLVEGIDSTATATISRVMQSSEGMVTATEDEVGGLIGRAEVKASGSGGGGGYGYGGGSNGIGTLLIQDSYAYGVVQGRNKVGGLAGHAISDASTSYGTSTLSITNSKAYGPVTGSGDDVGGLVGRLAVKAGADSSGYGNVLNNFSYGNVSGVGNVGGLIGAAGLEISGNGYGKLEVSDNRAGTSSGSVSGSGAGIGGLIGGISLSGASNYGYGNVAISGNYAYSEVIASGTGVSGMGGLVGAIALDNTGSAGQQYTVDIFGNYGNGSVTATNADRVGGLVGSIEVKGDSTYGTTGVDVSDNRYAYGTSASVTGNNHVGGLIGSISATAQYGEVSVSSNRAYGSVTGSGDHVGGLVGSVTATVDGANIYLNDNSAYSSSVTGANNVGGLVGSIDAINYGAVYLGGNQAGSGSYAMSVTGSGDRVGGLVGLLSASSYGTVRSSNDSASANAQGANYVGGLIGSVTSSSDGSVDISYGTANGSVNGGHHVGGLIGLMELASDGRNLNVSYGTANGNVSGTSDYIGGLVGQLLNGTVDHGNAYGTVQGINRVGGLVGQMNSGAIISSHAQGDVQGTNHVGGLVGQIFDYGSVRYSSASGTVTGTDNIGGLIGSAVGVYGGIGINNNNASGNVQGRNNVGGLVGYGKYADLASNLVDGATVSGSGTRIGGLVGYNYQGMIDDNQVKNATINGGGSEMGGLVGYNDNYDASGNYGGIINSKVTNTRVTGTNYVGGMIGRDYYGFHDTYNKVGNNTSIPPDVVVTGERYVGGLAGSTYGSNINSTQLQVEVHGRSYTGGAVGMDMNSTFVGVGITSSRIYALADAGTNEIYAVGGVIGKAEGSLLQGIVVQSGIVRANDPTATTIHAIGGMVGDGFDVNIQDSGGVGTVVGANLDVGYAAMTGTVHDIGGIGGVLVGGSVSKSRSSGSINVVGNTSAGATLSNIGGVVGLADGVAISEVSSNRTITAAGASNIGGLVGNLSNGSSITDAYSEGTINASGASTVGGLVGLMDSTGSPVTIDNTYSVTQIQGSNAATTGSLVGTQAGTTTIAQITDSFYNNTTNAGITGVGGGVADSTGNVEGKTTAELQDINTFLDAGWNIVVDGEGTEYPKLGYASYNANKWTIKAAAPSTTDIYLLLLTGSSLYGDTPTLTYALYDSATGGNLISNANPSGTVTWSTPITSTTNANTYGETYINGITLGNTSYSLLVGNSINWIVNPKPLDLTVSKTYNGSSTFNNGFSLSGMANGNAEPTVSGSASAASANAATYNNFASSTLALSNPNYTLSGGNVTATIDPAALSVSASDATKIYGQTPTLTSFTSSGLQNGESIGSVTLVSVGTSGTAVVAGSPYAITANNATGGTFSSGNYTITYHDGSLTVTPAALSVTASDVTKIYGQTPALTNFTSSGLQNGENIGAVTLASAGTAGTADVASSPYAITASNATGGTFSSCNYTITYHDGSLIITSAAPLVQPIVITNDQIPNRPEPQPSASPMNATPMTPPLLPGAITSGQLTGTLADGGFVSGGFVAVKPLDVTMTETAVFVYHIPQDAFAHSNAKALIILTARMADGSMLPGWMSFDPVNWVITGTPPQGMQDDDFDVVIFATDQFGGMARTELKIHVSKKALLL